MAYVDRLLAELGVIADDLEAIIQGSEIKYVNPNDSQSAVFFFTAADWGWAKSDRTLETKRMALLKTVRRWRPRFELLFPHPTPEVSERHREALNLMERWLVRDGGWDHSIPQTLDAAVAVVRQGVAVLAGARELLPADEFRVRAVIDTNALIDNPDLAAYTDVLGPRYRVHVLPVVLGEIDDLKRSGRSQTLREGAQRADKRLKGLRDNGDVLAGVRVAGDVSAIFEHVEPPSSPLDWLDLTVPDDRLVAGALILQSSYPGSALYVITGDINVQTKLAAAGLPFVETATP